MAKKSKMTPIETPRIIQPGEGSVRPLLWILFLVALGAWSWQVFEFGHKDAGFNSDRRDQVEQQLRERITELESERDTLRAESARFERSAQIDQAAVDDVKERVKALQEERANLKREVAFLKSLVSGDDSSLILSDYLLNFVDDHVYRFEATLSKRGEEPETVTGRVAISVKGTQEGKATTLDMESLTQGKRTNIGIRFKNFQKLESEIRLPDGFQPASVVVQVQPDGEGQKGFERVFEWKLSGA